MTLFALKDLRGNIVRCTANSTLSFAIKLKFSGETEISDFDLHPIVEEQVTKLQISVNHTVAVQILNGRAYLIQIALYFDLMQALPTTQQLVKCLVLTEFKEDVHVFSIFKEVFEAHNVVVVETAMNLNF